MNLNLKQLLFWMIMVCSISSYAQQIQSINLSTGRAWNNSLLNEGDADYNWSVTTPGGAIQTPRVHLSNSWAESGCSRWIVPVNVNGQIMPVTYGTYTYRLTFTISNPRIDCAKLVINAIGADNKLTGLYINSNNYTPAMPGGNNHFNPLTTNQTLYINPAHLINGTNTLTITIYNDPFDSEEPTTMAGLNLCGQLRLNDPDFNIHPVITGPTTICDGSPLTFGGSLAPGSSPSTHYLWKIVECDAAGNVVAGGLSWESWYTGVPVSTYTFPSNLNLICHKYYMAVLAGVRQSGCANWAQDTHVFKYACKPSANAGVDKTVCQGECVTIGTSIGIKGVSYSWSTNGTTIGAGLSVSVCPEVTTTYTITATDNATGCTNTDQVIVTVLPNQPRFNISTNTANNDYYTVTGTPIVMNANAVSGFGQYWSLEELDANNNSLFYIQNPTVWWPYPASCTFTGFDDYSLNYSGNISTLPSSPSVGKFLYNHTYRITRATWNNNCEWNAYSNVLTTVKSANNDGGYQVIVQETKAPDFRPMTQKATMNNWSVSPNPSNGVFNILSESQETEKTVFEVFDLFGKKIQSKVIEAGTTSLSINLSENAKGVYILNITTDGVSATQKITIE